jgi:hypothetical protein
MPPCVTVVIRAALIAMTLTPAFAETAATDPVADLAILIAKAEAEPALNNYLRDLTRMNGANGDKRVLVKELLNQIPGTRYGFTKPIHYTALVAVNLAQRRAQTTAEIMSADLNNDGQITKAEVKDTLEFKPEQGIAQAFFTSDANDDSILQPDEIRAAVETQLAAQSYGRDDQQIGMAKLLDFDDDGYLTAEEFDRGSKALGY